MTEDEAKTKWCPMVRLTATGDPVNGGEWHSNRMPKDDRVNVESTYLCIGSGCMMWRWTFVDEALTDSRTDGYCGLAGKP